MFVVKVYVEDIVGKLEKIDMWKIYLNIKTGSFVEFQDDYNGAEDIFADDTHIDEAALENVGDIDQQADQQRLNNAIDGHGTVESLEIKTGHVRLSPHKSLIAPQAPSSYNRTLSKLEALFCVCLQK